MSSDISSMSNSQNYAHPRTFVKWNCMSCFSVMPTLPISVYIVKIHCVAPSCPFCVCKVSCCVLFSVCRPTLCVCKVSCCVFFSVRCPALCVRKAVFLVLFSACRPTLCICKAIFCVLFSVFRPILCVRKAVFCVLFSVWRPALCVCKAVFCVLFSVCHPTLWTSVRCLALACQLTLSGKPPVSTMTSLSSDHPLGATP